MAPFSILAPFLGRKGKKYEKLETEDPEKKKQEATQEELVRINHKIDKLVNSMTRDDFEPASCPDEECLSCGSCRAVMQVSPCGHQALCRLCFVRNIQEAVSSRNLPLCCIVCTAKILRVKNNSRGSSREPRPLPKSVSGYSIRSLPQLPYSNSNYSMNSGLSSMSASSYGSNRSLRSTGSVRSVGSANSWFSVNSLSSFQCASLDKGLAAKPRVFCPMLEDSNDSEEAHSITRGRSRAPPQGMSGSVSSPSIRSLASSSNPTLPTQKCLVPSVVPHDNVPASNSRNHSAKSPSAKPNLASYNSKPNPTPSSNDSSYPASPSRETPSVAMFDRGLRALQGYSAVPPREEEREEKEANRRVEEVKVEKGGRSSLPPSREVNKGRKGKENHHGRRKAKSPDLAETSFTMSTIQEENEGKADSLKSLNSLKNIQDIV